MAHPIYKLGEDAYIEWSSIVDAPISPVMTYAEAFARYSPDRMIRVEANGHSHQELGEQTPEQLVGCNRAGPGECSLTVAAILRLYAPGQGDPGRMDQTLLRPEDIRTTWTNWFTDDGAVEDEHGPIYVWTPWRPGEEPGEITAETDLHATTTRIYAEELAGLQASWRAEQVTE